MSRVFLKNKITGITYVYECISFWDKAKKKPGSKRTCIGKLDPITGELIPSKRLSSSITQIAPDQTAAVKSVGATQLLEDICHKLEVDKIIKETFPEHWELILSLAYFQTMEKKPLSKIEHWTEVHDHPYGQFIDHRRVSELLPLITEDKQLVFFKKWAKLRMQEECLAYDITSISSYSQLNNMVRLGYNRDGESLSQINLAMLFGEQSQLPVYFRTLPGSIRDVSTLKHFLQMASFLQMKQPHIIMDKGFFSHANINDLLVNRMHFTVAIPFTCDFAKEQVAAVRNTINDHTNFLPMKGQNMFCHSKMTKWAGKRVYVHVYYNAQVAAEEYNNFLTDLHTCKEELEQGCPQEEHQQYYDLFFFVKQTPKRGRKVTYNQQAIDAYKENTAGFLVLLSNTVKDAAYALQTYRDKDLVEKTFDDLKNSIDSKRLRVHLDESMKERLFIQFIALIFISYISKNAHDKDIFKLFGSVSGILDELKLYNEVSISGQRQKICSERTKAQKVILKAFDLT
jgi:transposase